MNDAAFALAFPLVRDCEGFRSAPYQDVAGIWTIGYGFTRWHGRPVRADTPHIMVDAAEAYLADLLMMVMERVDAMCHTALSDHELAALSSLAFNIGTPALASSTLMKRLNVGDRDGAAAQFDAWVRSKDRIIPGLVRRRAIEKALFLTA